RAYRRKVRRNISQRNILAERWRRTATRNYPDFFPSAVEHLVAVPPDPALNHLKPNESAFQSSRARFCQCGTSDKVALLHFAVAVKPRFPNVDRIADFVLVERHFCFKPQCVSCAKSTRYDTELFAGLNHRVPNGFTRLNVSRQVNFNS